MALTNLMKYYTSLEYLRYSHTASVDVVFGGSAVVADACGTRLRRLTLDEDEIVGVLVDLRLVAVLARVFGNRDVARDEF